MFFGLEVKCHQNQAKPIVLANTLKLSQAVLEPGKVNGNRDPVCLVAEYQNKQFILCVLDPAKTWQCPLDLLFEGGSKVKFFIRGSGTVHITGYENFDDLDDMELSMSSDSETEQDQSFGSKSKSPAKKSTSSKRPTKSLPEFMNASATDESDEDDEDYGGESDDSQNDQSGSFMDEATDEESDNELSDEEDGGLDGLDDDDESSDGENPNWLEDEDISDDDDEDDEDVSMEDESMDDDSCNDSSEEVPIYKTHESDRDRTSSSRGHHH